MSNPVCPVPISQDSSRTYPAGRGSSSSGTRAATNSGESSVADELDAGAGLVSLLLLVVLLGVLAWSWVSLEASPEKDTCKLQPSKLLPRVRPTTQNAAILAFGRRLTANASAITRLPSQRRKMQRSFSNAYRREVATVQ